MGFQLEKDDNGYLMNPAGRVLGYVRVSTKDQNPDRQIIDMKNYGVEDRNIIVEYESGKNFNRPLYKKLIHTLREGDILVIKSIDRLGRNYQDIIDQWRLITQDLGCGIHVLDMPALNTTGDPEDLLSKFITDMMLQVLSFVAQQELESLHARQRQGIAAAKLRGDVDMGRPKVKISRDFWNVYVIWRNGLVQTKELIKYCADHYGISQRTFYRKLDDVHLIFKHVKTEDLRDVDMSEYDIDWEHLTGNDDERNAEIPDLKEYTEEEIIAEIMQKRAEALPKEPKKRKKYKKRKKGKVGRPPKTPEEKARQARDKNTIRTIIVD